VAACYRKTVQTELDEDFRVERTRYHLAFTCEDCVYFDRVVDRCSHGYPSAVHRRAAFEAGGPRDGMFCKEFELA
jgi:hypothetical protein